MPDSDGKTAGRIKPQAAAPPAKPEATAFYAEAIQMLLASGIPFLLGGTYAFSAYTGIVRPTKDLDVCCAPGDKPRILAWFHERGYQVVTEDERWLGKIIKDDDFVDVIFASPTGTMTVGESWFANAHETELFGTRVRLVGPTELIWSKCFIQLRHRYDGADIAHLFLRAHDLVNWRQLLAYMDAHWEVLLIHLLNFRWIYPAERDRVPAWLLDELLDRLAKQRELAPPRVAICRGRIYSRIDYEVDVTEWGLRDACDGRE